MTVWRLKNLGTFYRQQLATLGTGKIPYEECYLFNNTIVRLLARRASYAKWTAKEFVVRDRRPCSHVEIETKATANFTGTLI